MSKKNDILWKGIIEEIFDDLLRFIFPEADQLVDMERGFDFLDKELSEITGKTNTMGIMEMVAEMRVEEARELTRKEERENLAKKLLTNTDHSSEEIALLVDVPLSVVEKIKERLNQQ